MLSRLNQRKFKSILFYLVAWIVAGIVFYFFRFVGQESTYSTLALQLFVQFSILGGLSQGVHEVYVLRDDRFRRPFLESLVIRGIYHASMISVNMLVVYFLWSMLERGNMFLPGYQEEIKALVHFPDIWIFFFYAYFTGNLVTFLRSVNKKSGPRMFFNSFLGKYQDPTEEERVFLFLDLRSATTLAEEIGHYTYSSFLRDYFRLVSNCCVENHGEVYQFAGDGVFLTWRMDHCRRRARPLVCYRDLVECFRNTRGQFEKKYGRHPEFKAAIHVGRVIATEVGNFGSSMAYHGDALNTTARLQSMCNLLKQDLLVSETFVRKMPSLEGFALQSQGSYQLKGKKEELEVFGLL